MDASLTSRIPSGRFAKMTNEQYKTNRNYRKYNHFFHKLPPS